MNDAAPPGKKWFCLSCGKSADRLSSEDRGWDESCALNAVLIDGLSIGPSHKQVFEFEQQKAAALARNFDALGKLTEQIKNREVPSSEWLRKAIDKAKPPLLTPSKENQ